MLAALQAEYRVVVEALDGGSPPLSGGVEVVVRVVDANDNSPVFERPDYDVTVAENVAQMTTIAQVGVQASSALPNRVRRAVCRINVGAIDAAALGPFKK